MPRHGAQEIAIPGVVEKGPPHLTHSEAQELAYSEGTVENRGELLALLGLSGAGRLISPNLYRSNRRLDHQPGGGHDFVVGIGAGRIFTAGFGVAGF